MLVGTTAFLAAILTNDVAVFLVVPFTMLLGQARPPLATLVVLEVLADNLLGALTPIGDPQNVFLYARGGFTPSAFVETQLPLVVASAVLLLGAVFLLVPDRRLAAASSAAGAVDPMLAIGFALLFSSQIASLLGPVPYPVPLALAVPGTLLLGRRLREADFSIVLVFALLFIGIPGLERGRLYQHLNPGEIFGHHAIGLMLSGALLSQFVSNVPAAFLLAPAVATPLGMQGLLYGVTIGACGSPIGSIANLIGAQIYSAKSGDTRSFWRALLPISVLFLAALTVFAALFLIEGR